MDGYNTIFLHWKKSQKDFDNNLLQLQQRINTEAIHDIRVAIKKLRAFLDLYMLLKKEPEWEYFLNKTENLFDVLGRHRDVEICLELTAALEKETNCSCKEWKNYLQSVLKITRAWANQEIHRYHKKELAKIALLLKQDNSFANGNKFSNDLTAIINQHLADAKKYFRQPHLLRKKLKEAYYWIALFPGENIPESWHQKELQSILIDLGNWQDNEILAVRIKHFRKDYLPNPFEEYQVLKDLQNKIEDNKKLLLKAANSKARRWIKKVLVPNKEKSEE
jgi:CHAD domain-containing protein